MNTSAYVWIVSKFEGSLHKINIANLKVKLTCSSTRLSVSNINFLIFILGGGF